jgi:uncharacterized membrane protein YgcG
MAEAARRTEKRAAIDRGHLGAGPLALSAAVALLACLIAVACESTGGSSCFSPVQGPADTSCAGFDEGLVCPVNLSPWYTCTCTMKTWACVPTDSAGDTGGTGGTGGAGGSGGMGTGGGSGGGGTGGSGDAGAD